jgi:hypothetical protein
MLPAIAVFVLVSSQTGFNRYFRYVLPALPFLFVWASQAARIWGVCQRSATVRGGIADGRVAASGVPCRCGAWLVASAMVWSICSSLACFPHSMSYFSDLVGGPRRGHEHLIDGNIDWGQDLFYLRDWIEQHPHARPLTVAYMGFFDPHAARIDFPKTPAPSPQHHTGPALREGGNRLQPGWHAVSMQYLISDSHEYDELMKLEPTAFAGYSIRIYRITPDGMAALRRTQSGTPGESGTP